MSTNDIPYLVEKMTVADVPAVADLERKVFPLPWSAHAFEYELCYNPMAHFWVVRLRRTDTNRAEQKNLPKEGKKQIEQNSAHYDILGYGGFWLFLDEAHICTLAVHPDWRGRGLGEFLLSHMISQAILLHAAVLTLEVRVSNLVAQKLYQKYGFTVAGLRKKYYSDNNEDALIMTTEPICSASFQRHFQALKSSLQQKLTAQLT